MFEPREKWFRGSIFFSLKSLLVRRGESWLADRGQRRPCSGNPEKGISMVSWNSSSPNSSSFPEGQKRDLREKKREEITSPPSENLIFIHPDSFLRREVFLSPPPLPPGMGLRPDLVAATMIYGLKWNFFTQPKTNSTDRLFWLNLLSC